MIELREALEILAREGRMADRSVVAKSIRAGRLGGTLTRNAKGITTYTVDLDQLREWARRRDEHLGQLGRVVECEPDESPIRIARVRGYHPTRGTIHATRIFSEPGARAARRVISSLSCDLREQGCETISRRATVVPIDRSALGLPE